MCCATAPAPLAVPTWSPHSPNLQLFIPAFSPLPRLPAGMLLVVGGCWAGMPPEANRTADLLATVTDSADDMQLFWEVGAGVHAFLFMLLGACHQPCGMNGRAWHGAACTCGGMGMVYHGMAWHGMAWRIMTWQGLPCVARSPSWHDMPCELRSHLGGVHSMFRMLM